MKKALACLALMALPCLAATIPTTSYICEMSDTSSDNQFAWNIIRGESRYFQVQYQQNGTNANLSDASSTNAYLYLKASDSTNTYRVDGYITDTSNGVVRVLWAATNAPKASVYMVEFAVPDSPELNLAARGKLTVKNGTGSGVATNMPYYPTLEDDVSGLSTTQALHTAAISGLQSTQATILATGYLTAGSNVSSLINDSGYITATGTNGLASLTYVDGAVSNWSYYVAKSNVNMAGLAITNMTSASMETGIVDVIYRKNGYKLMDSSALYWDNPLTGWSVVFDSGALVSPSSGTSLDWQNYHLTNGEWKVSNAANEGHEIVNWNVLTGTKISSSTNSDTANVASNLTETATNSLMTLASNLFGHGSIAMGYLICSNNTNEIIWYGDFVRPLTITNIGWFSTVGDATGTLFLANNATAPSAWDSICYTGLAFAAQARSNAAVSIDVTAGQRIGFMCAPCTNPTVFLGY